MEHLEGIKAVHLEGWKARVSEKLASLPVDSPDARKLRRFIERVEEACARAQEPQGGEQRLS